MELLNKILIKLVLVSMALLMVVLGDRTYNSVQSYSNVEGSHGKLSDKIDTLHHEIEMLETERERLSKDYSYYEQISREAFGMIKEDEVVYIVPLP